jgi:hypothetical protein
VSIGSNSFFRNVNDHRIGFLCPLSIFATTIWKTTIIVIFVSKEKKDDQKEVIYNLEKEFESLLVTSLNCLVRTSSPESGSFVVLVVLGREIVKLWTQ